MPIPAAPEGDPSPQSATLALFLQLHDQVRAELANVSDSCLAYIPVSGANSISAIITHLVGSEAETLRAVAGEPVRRDRDAEFQTTRLTSPLARALLDAADQLVRQLAPLITQERLVARIALPTLPPDELRPGITWLIGNYGHAREHVGQIQLTKQLFALEH